MIESIRTSEFPLQINMFSQSEYVDYYLFHIIRTSHFLSWSEYVHSFLYNFACNSYKEK